MALFAAIDILFAQIFVIKFSSNFIFDFQTLAASICGYVLGPLWASVSLVAGYLLGWAVFGGFFPGYILSAAVRGFMFGRLLHKKEVESKNFVLSVGVVFLTTDMILNSIWEYIIAVMGLGQGPPDAQVYIFLSGFGPMILGKIALLAIDMFLAYYFAKYLKQFRQLRGKS